MLSTRFRTTAEEGNLDHAPELFHEDVTFRSPVLFKPYEGREKVLKVLEAAERVLGLGDRFRYVHQLEDPGERVAILEFATEVDGKQVEGINKLTFDEDGRITELKVMSGLPRPCRSSQPGWPRSSRGPASASPADHFPQATQFPAAGAA